MHNPGSFFLLLFDYFMSTMSQTHNRRDKKTMADVDMSDAPKRCASNQPQLADAIKALVPGAEPDVQPHLNRLAEALHTRTVYCPAAVTTAAVGAALEGFCRNMVDAGPFARRHEEAFTHFGITL